MDTSKFVERLTKAGFTEADAISQVARISDGIEKVMKGESEVDKKKILSMKIGALIEMAKNNKFQILMVAQGPRSDRNGYNRAQNMKAYDQNPEEAISQGLVKIIKGEPVSIDNREFFDAARTKKNLYGYGRPWPVQMQRESIALLDKEMIKVTGDFDMEPGGVYDIYGTDNGNGVIYTAKKLQPHLIKKLSKPDFYEKVNDAALSSDLGFDVQNAIDAENVKGAIVIKGYINSIEETGNGNRYVTLGSDLGQSIIGFSSGEEVSAAMVNLYLGAEVLCVGRLRNKEGYGNQITVLGFVTNPSSFNATPALKKLAEYGI